MQFIGPCRLSYKTGIGHHIHAAAEFDPEVERDAQNIHDSGKKPVSEQRPSIAAAPDNYRRSAQRPVLVCAKDQRSRAFCCGAEETGKHLPDAFIEIEMIKAGAQTFSLSIRKELFAEFERVHCLTFMISAFNKSRRFLAPI